MKRLLLNFGSERHVLIFCEHFRLMSSHVPQSGQFHVPIIYRAECRAGAAVSERDTDSRVEFTCGADPAGRLRPPRSAAAASA